MDPMKQNDIQETVYTDPVTDEKVIDAEDIQNNEIKEPFYVESLENGVELVDPEEEEESILDIDDGEEGMHLTAAQEQEAEMTAVQKTVAWMKEHPHYTMEELSKAKAELLAKARKEIFAGTHAKHEQ